MTLEFSLNGFLNFSPTLRCEISSSSTAASPLLEELPLSFSFIVSRYLNSVEIALSRLIKSL